MSHENNEIVSVLKTVLNNNPITMARAIAEEFVKKEKLSHQEIKEIVGDGFKLSFAEKVKELSGYFQNTNQSFFNEHLNNTYEKAVQNFLTNDKELNKKLDKLFKKHLKEMNVEKLVLEFFNSKKDLCMELMLKNMFSNK